MRPGARSTVRLMAVVIPMIIATVLLGWIGPVAMAIGFAAVHDEPTLPRDIGLGAALAWGLVILFTVIVGGVRSVALLGAALQMPAFVLPLASILFVAGLAWSTTTLVAALRRTILARRPREEVVEMSVQ